MSDQIIPSVLIEKLSHKLLEIRERALFNIISKLENGFIFDNNLARSKEIISKLFQWFRFEDCTNEKTVLGLLKNILSSESGRILINHYGSDLLQEELNKIRSFIEPTFYEDLDAIFQLLNKEIGGGDNFIIPPLHSEVPLSYRTNCSTYRENVGTTVTVREGFIEEPGSLEQETGFQPISSYSSSEQSQRSDCGYLESTILQWQPLIETDRHVLQSVEKSLINPPQLSALIHSCEFFNNVLLHDFPAEIFLQRPTIVLQFMNLVKNATSSRISNAALNCLCHLTKALQVRVNHYNDVAMCNLKLESLLLVCASPVNDNMSVKSGGSSVDENVDELKRNQISLQSFCWQTIQCLGQYLCIRHENFAENRSKYNLVGINSALTLFEEIIQLIRLTVNRNIWQQKMNSTLLEVFQGINKVLMCFGEILEYFRLESSSSTNDDCNFVAIYLIILHNCVNLLRYLVPLNKSRQLFPKILKTALANTLLNVALGRMYPSVYETILEYVESFSVDGGIDLLKKYRDVQRVCGGISATVTIIKSYKNLNLSEIVTLTREAIPSLEFHKNLKLLEIFVEICSKKMNEKHIFSNVIEDVSVHFLAHHLLEVRQEMYRLCHKIVLNTIGPKFSSDTSSILFLIHPKILTEICVHGISSDNYQIQKYADDIILHILKCKPLVTEEIWIKIVEVLIGIFPIVCCYINKKNSLGRTILNILDPDVAKPLQFPDETVLKSNIQFLFTDEASVRDEAFSRICWLLASRPNCRELLPRLNNLYDKSLSAVCVHQAVLDVNKLRHTQHFYEPSSLKQVLEVLKSSVTPDPLIRRSAISQLSAMLEDPLLHQIFIHDNGVEIVTQIMTLALKEDDFDNYPDSIVPIITILKNLCLYNSLVRLQLSSKLDVLIAIIRGLFMFFNEERVKIDATTLLFCLIFKDFFLGSPSNGNLSVPLLVKEKLRVPFECQTHWSGSIYVGENLLVYLSGDKLCMNSIQLQWNSDIRGGFNDLISCNKEISYKDTLFTTPDLLKLNQYNLQLLQSSSIDFSLNKYLNSIQNGTSHGAVMDAVEKLSMYINLYRIITRERDLRNGDEENVFFEHPWQNSFMRFLKTLPSSEEDVTLLRAVIKCLILLVPCYKKSEITCWITTTLKDHSNCLLDLLDVSNTTDEEAKILNQELLLLITTCACQEQYYLDYYQISGTTERDNKSWQHVIHIVADNLKFNDAHFYNLAYLDALLLCLVHLTASLGWSKSKSTISEPIPQMITGLCELVSAFHCGKGPTAAHSVMGLSITRHALLILNHLVGELQSGKIKGWESCFLSDVEGGNCIFKSFVALWYSRDVVLRAAAVQFFSGLAVSARISNEIVFILKDESNGIYELALSVLMDNNEASIVRENAALLLGHLTSHIYYANNSVRSNAMKNDGKYLLDLLSRYDFFNRLDVILNSLFIMNFHSKPVNFHRSSSTSSSDHSWNSKNEQNVTITTPGVIKGVTIFLHNVLSLSPNEISSKLFEIGLVKLLFRCIYNPTISVDNTKELSLYCDILEMNTILCQFLTKISQCNSACLGTILHTRDCLNVLLTLLNPKIYHINYPQLLYLRNKLWSEIFNLLGTLLEFSSAQPDDVSLKSLEALTIFTDALFESKTHQSFLETICESLSSLGSHELQSSVLASVSNLFKAEINRIVSKTDLTSQESIQSLLDDTRTSLELKLQDKKSISERTTSKTDLLETVFFNKMEEKSSTENELTTIGVAGEKICKILLYLYDYSTVKQANKLGVIFAMSGILAVSKEAKNFALHNGFMKTVMKQLREFYIKLSLESVECLRRVSDKKRLCPVLKELNELIGLLTNFLVDSVDVKRAANDLFLADVIHKLWIWFLVQNSFLLDVLQMLCTFTTDCDVACQSLPLTSAVAGSGPRKLPSNYSLLHAILTIISKEMDQISKTHNLNIIKLSFNILCNCVPFLECRLIFSKSTLLQGVLRLHPAITKRQKPWDSVEAIWLNFLETYTKYPEGQAAVAKISDVLDVILSLTSSTNIENRCSALIVLRNLSFYQSNKPRLLSSGDFLNVLYTKLSNGLWSEKHTVVVIMWALAANCQKAKIIFKSAQLDVRLQDMIRHYQLCDSSEVAFQEEDVNRMYYLLNILKDNTEKDR